MHRWTVLARPDTYMLGRLRSGILALNNPLDPPVYGVCTKAKDGRNRAFIGIFDYDSAFGSAKLIPIRTVFAVQRTN